MKGALTDEEIVRHIRAGRSELFELLMHRHADRLSRAVRSVLKDDAQAEDVVQETYARAFAHLDDFAGVARFSTWLTRIAVHEAIGRVRKESNVEVVNLGFVEVGSLGEDPEGAAANRQLGEAVQRAVDALPDTYREVFVLRVLDGLSVAQTAEALGVSSDTVKMRTFRATAQVRAQLSCWLAGDSGIQPRVGGRRHEVDDVDGGDGDARRVHA